MNIYLIIDELFTCMCIILDIVSQFYCMLLKQLHKAAIHRNQKPLCRCLWVQTHDSWFMCAYFPVSGMEETENKTNNKLKFQVL